MNRTKILDTAKNIITHDRNNQYGGMEDNFNKIAEYWSLYLGKKITGHDVAMMMLFLKIARVQTGKTNEDNYIDIAGYVACAGEIALKEEIK